MKAGLLILALLSASVSAAERFEYEEPHMGTKFRIVLYADDRTSAAAAVRAAFAKVTELESVLSDYRPDSEAMKLCIANDKAPGKAIPISDDLCNILAAAMIVSKDSQGAFDVTIGPLSKLWRQTRKLKKLPDGETLATAKARVGWEKLTLDAQAKTLKLGAGMRLDFGGIGKGYAAQEALVVLKKLGIGSALVAASGDISVSDAPPGRDTWIVEIAPLDPKDPPRKLKLKNAAVSTSGDLFQHVEIEGVRYSHVLDPQTGLGLTGFRSVTVIAKDGTHADALSKVASIMPVADALKVVEKHEASALIVVKNARPAESSSFRNYILD